MKASTPADTAHIPLEVSLQDPPDNYGTLETILMKKTLTLAALAITLIVSSDAHVSDTG
jgi:hypothetical protein